MDSRKGTPTTWAENVRHLGNLVKALDESVLLFKDWRPKDEFENMSFTFLEKIRVNLMACRALMPKVLEREIHFLPIGLIFRTVITDIIVYKYLRTVWAVAGVEGVKQELNVIDRDFVNAMIKIFNSLKIANPDEADSLDGHFQASYADYINPDGRVKSAKSMRVNQDVEAKIAAYLKTHQISAPDTAKEGGKIEFLSDPNKNNLQYLYTYLAQLHHYTTKSFLFYKDVDFRRKNIEHTGGVIWFVAACIFDVFFDLFPDSPIRSKFHTVAEEIVGEPVPLSSQAKAC